MEILKELAFKTIIGFLTILIWIIFLCIIIPILGFLKPYAVAIKDTAKIVGGGIIEDSPIKSVSVGLYSPIVEADIGINDQGESKSDLTFGTSTKPIKFQSTSSRKLDDLLAFNPEVYNESKSVKFSGTFFSTEFAVNKDGSLKYLAGFTVKIPANKNKKYGGKVSVKLRSDEDNYRIRNYSAIPFELPKPEIKKPQINYSVKKRCIYSENAFTGCNCRKLSKFYTCENLMPITK